jgi:hypothetical protein
MRQPERREVRQRLANASPRTLRAALTAVLDADADAQRAHTDDPADQTLGWFADGTDTAAVLVYTEVLGRAPAEATS